MIAILNIFKAIIVTSCIPIWAPHYTTQGWHNVTGYISYSVLMVYWLCAIHTKFNCCYVHDVHCISRCSDVVLAVFTSFQRALMLCWLCETQHKGYWCCLSGVHFISKYPGVMSNGVHDITTCPDLISGSAVEQMVNLWAARYWVQ